MRGVATFAAIWPSGCGSPIRALYLKDLHMPVGEVVPVPNCKSCKHMDVHVPGSGILRQIIRKSVRAFCDLAKPVPDQIAPCRWQALMAFDHLDGYEQPLLHSADGAMPSRFSASSKVSQRPGVLSSISLVMRAGKSGSWRRCSTDMAQPMSSFNSFVSRFGTSCWIASKLMGDD